MATLFRHSFPPFSLSLLLSPSISNPHNTSLFSFSRHAVAISSHPFFPPNTPSTFPQSSNTNTISPKKRFSAQSSSNPNMGSLSAREAVKPISSLQYPLARRDDSVVDDYHGIRIADPYRWLENPDSDEVKEFVEKQADLTESLLQKCETREDLQQKITEMFDHPRYDTPFKKGDRYFYFHNTGLQAQSVLYVQDGLEGKAEVLLDPNGLSEDGTVALNKVSMSENAEFLVYEL